MSQDNAQVVEAVTGIKKKGRKLTQERVRELFDLDYETGILVWKTRNSFCIQIGREAGCVCSTTGYLSVGVDGRNYTAHKIIWLHIHGYIPESDIDHIDRNRLNNAPCNLREVSRSCNNRNTGNHSHNTSGVKGVSWYKATNKWRCRIAVYGIEKSLGYFDDFTEAVAHRLAAEQFLDWEGCDSCSPAFGYIQNYLLDKKYTVNNNCGAKL